MNVELEDEAATIFCRLRGGDDEPLPPSASFVLFPFFGIVSKFAKPQRERDEPRNINYLFIVST